MSDLLSSLKFMAIVVGASAASTSASAGPVHVEWLHLEITTAYFGVPFNVLVGAAVGSLVGVWNQKIDDRGSLTVSFLSSTVLAIGASVLGPEFTGYRWSSTGVHAAAAMLLGFTAQNWGPELIRSAGALAKQLLRRFLPPKEGQP